MAQTQHLPIYKAVYDLCVYFEQIVRGFSRYHKYAIGSELREGSRRALRLVVRANSRRDKVAVLMELRETVEEMKALVPSVPGCEGVSDMCEQFAAASDRP